MDNNHQQLIDQLCEDLEPVKPLWAPSTRAVLWLVFCFSISIALVLLTGDLRSGYIKQLLGSPRFLIETAMGFLSGIVAAFFAFEMVVPGIKWTPKLKLLSIAPFIIFCLMVLYSVFDPPVSVSWHGWRYGCEQEIIFFGALPMIVFFVLAKRAAPTEDEWTGLLIGISAVAPSAALMHLACMYQPWHLLGFHIAPVVFVALIGAVLAKRQFKF